jgi:hypothetical protein
MLGAAPELTEMTLTQSDNRAGILFPGSDAASSTYDLQNPDWSVTFADEKNSDAFGKGPRLGDSSVGLCVKDQGRD